MKATESLLHAQSDYHAKNITIEELIEVIEDAKCPDCGEELEGEMDDVTAESRKYEATLFCAKCSNGTLVIRINPSKGICTIDEDADEEDEGEDFLDLTVLAADIVGNENDEELKLVYTNEAGETLEVPPENLVIIDNDSEDSDDVMNKVNMLLKARKVPYEFVSLEAGTESFIYMMRDRKPEAETCECAALNSEDPDSQYDCYSIFSDNAVVSSSIVGRKTKRLDC